MDLRASLINDTSKENAIRIADWVGEDPKRMEKLMKVFFNGNFRENQRAAYPLIFLTDRNPSLFEPYFKELIDYMTDDVHDAVIRNTLRLFQFVDLPEEIEGLLYEKCYHYFRSPNYPVAIRVFAMTIMTNICKKYPELKVELLPLIEEVMKISDSGGIKSRGRKMIQILNKL